MPFEKMTMSDGAEIDVYRAAAKGVRKGGLVLVQEIFGVTEHIRELCDEYAEDGYEVLAPALFDREHPGFEAKYNDEDLARGRELARKLHPIDLSVADVRTCFDALADEGPVFVVGYCYGGSISFLAACRIERLAAVSGYYGGQIMPFIDEEPKCPMILHFGRFDPSIPMADVVAITAAHPDVTVFLYEAGHGFNSARPELYHAPSADLARERTLALFEACGRRV